MANRFDYFPLYYLRLLLDTQDMSTLEFGAYMRILLHAWDQKPVGSVSRDETALAAIGRVSPDEWAGMRAKILGRFKIGRGNRLLQKRMKAVYQQVLAASEGRSEAGKIGAEARWAKQRKNGDAPAMRSHNDRNAKETKGNETKEEEKKLPPSHPRKNSVADKARAVLAEVTRE